jgi:hypothetical protein
MKTCCEDIRPYIQRPGERPGRPISFAPEGRWEVWCEFGDEGPYLILESIKRCPFCGTELPKDGKWPES